MTDRQQRIVDKFRNQTSFTKRTFRNDTDQEILDYLGVLKKIYGLDFDAWMRGKRSVFK